MTNVAAHMEGQQHSLHAHVPDAHASAATHAKGQQHPIKLYLVVWGWLFVLSTCSYLVDFFGIHGHLRWSLIVLFMVLKAGLIVAVFMHMAWERLALAYAILLPPVLVLVFVTIMVLKAGLIVAVFMHMAWERLALAYAILLPPVLVLVFVTIMVLESDYTHLLRVIFFAPST